MPRRRDRPARFGLLALAAAGLFAGCQPKPKAPALLNDPVFQSAEGFRFLVPDGWLMAARGNVPPGNLAKECLLVQYRRTSGTSQATLEVSAADVPDDADLTDYLSGPSFSARRWDRSGSVEKVEAGGQPGTRHRFTALVNGARLAKDVTVFRRGGRVYFFTLLFAPSDGTAPEQIHRAVDKIVWTK